MKASCFALIGIGALAQLAPGQGDEANVRRYYVGVNTGWIQNVDEPTRIQWAFDAGATLPRIGMRMDFAKTMPEHPDAAVRRFCAAGRSGLAFMFNGGGQVKLPDGTTRQVEAKVPDKLWAPVFSNGKDEPSPGAQLNPENEWAAFVGQMVERYDGDGVNDAPDSPRLTYYSLYNEPDWMPWPQQPTDAKARTLKNWLGSDYGDLARFAFVSWQAAKFADPTCKIGLQLCFPSSLGFLLDDAKHPLARNVDFIDFHAYAWPGSDTLVEKGDGMLPLLGRMRAEFAKRKLPSPLFLCTEVGHKGDDAAGPQYSQAVQRAAVAKVNLVAASEPDMICAQWYALFDPSYQSMGLIADASKLPADGNGAKRKDAYWAMMTVARMLGPMAQGRMQFVEKLPVGDAARAFRFQREGQPLFVVWAADFTGEPKLSLQLKLSLPRGKYARYEWDFASTGRPAELVESDGEPTALTVGIDPVYLVGYVDPPAAKNVP